MVEYCIKESTLVGIADAIRAKTGKTDKICPTDMANEIAAIVTGGGSGDLVKYVTFMDGGTELFKMPVLSGDDCKDPIAHGDITTPTKGSTNTTNYTHNGWSLVAVGSADSNALKNVTEDRVVYASFAESVKYYTVNFYSEVGVLHETVQVTYGGTATPSKNPEKEGVSFGGWSPSNENITADTDLYAVWVEAITFASSTWADISRVCKAGQASQYFTVGETRDMVWTTKDGVEITTQLQIVGIDHDNLADGSGKAGISVMCVPLIHSSIYATETPQQPHKDNYGGGIAWDACSARTQLNTNFYNLLPSDLQSVIKEVKKISSNKSLVAVETVDKIWIPSVTEIDGNTGGTTGGQGSKYAYFTNADTRKKRLQSIDGTVATTASSYYTRSFTSMGMTYVIKSTGASATDQTANYNHAVGFCI